MSIERITPVSIRGGQRQTLSLLTTGLILSTAFTTFSIGILYVLLPRLIRKYASSFQIGQVRILSLKDVKWRGHRVWVKGQGMVMKSDSTSELEESGVGERTQVTLGSVGLRFGSNEGSRRQWLVLRLDSVCIKVPSAHLQPNKLQTSPDEVTDSRLTESSLDEYDQADGDVYDLVSTDGSSCQHRDMNHWNLIKTLCASIFYLSKSFMRRLLPRSPLPARFLLRVFRLMRLRVARPLLNKLNRCGRRLSWIISVFGLEVNEVTLEIDEICKVQCSIKIGFQLLRGDNSQLCCWITSKNTQVENITRSIRFPSKLSKGNAPTEAMMENEEAIAFSIPGCIEISASAELDPVIGLASILASSRRTGRLSQPCLASHLANTNGISLGRVIRPHSVNLKFKFLEATQNKKCNTNKARLPTSAGSLYLSVVNILDIVRALPRQETQSEATRVSHSSLKSPTAFASREHPRSNPTKFRGQSSTPKLFSLSTLRQLQVELPLLHCYYLIPKSVSSTKFTSNFIMPSQVSETQMSTHLHITGCFLNLNLSEERIERCSHRSHHVEWFGRGTSIPLRFSLRWLEVSVGVQMLSSGTLHDAPQKLNLELFKISETSLILSSSWLPDIVRQKCSLHEYFASSASHISFTGDHNDHIMVTEFEIGCIKGQIAIDKLLIIYELCNSIPSTSFVPKDNSASAEPLRNDADQSSPMGNKTIKKLPRFVAGVTVHSITYDIHGFHKPKQPAFTSGSEKCISGTPDHLKCTNALSFGCSAFHFNSTGEYVDLVIKRTDSEKRQTKTQASKSEIFVPQSLRTMVISKAHAEAVTDKSSSNDRLSSTDCQDHDHFEEENISLRRKEASTIKKATGIFLQAYPLPTPALKVTPWKSRVEILREMNLDFVYQLSISCNTSSVDIVLTDDSASEKASFGLTSLEVPLRRPSNLPQEVFGLMSVQVVSELTFAGWDAFSIGDDLTSVVDLSMREGVVRASIGEVTLQLWRPTVMSSLMHLSRVLTSLKARKLHHHASQSNTPPSRTNHIPHDVAFSLAIPKTGIRLAGYDPKYDSNIARGTKLEFKNLLLECFRQSTAQSGLYSCHDRLRLDLKEDIRMQANSKLLQNPEFDSCLFKCTADSIRLSSIPDATDSLDFGSGFLETARDDSNPLHHDSPSLWELKSRFNSAKPPAATSPTKSVISETEYDTFHHEQLGVVILHVDRLTIRTTLQTLKKPLNPAEDEVVIAINAHAIKSHLDAFHVYCVLLSASALTSLIGDPSPIVTNSSKSFTGRTRRTLHLGLRVEIQNVQSHTFLSPKVPIFLEMRRVSVQKSKRLGLDLRWDTLLLAGRSVTCPGFWDDVLKIKTCKIRLVETSQTNLGSDTFLPNRGCHPFVVIVEGDAARLRIPFKFIIAELVDSLSILIKTIKQMFHQFISGNPTSTSEPVVESPKRLPEIRIKFRIVVVQVEDDPFENKLNAIRRAGKEEVKERLARDESFENKIRELKAANKESPGHPDHRFSWGSKAQSPANSTGSVPEDDDSSINSSSSFSQAAEYATEVSIEEAHHRLEEYNAAAWIKRIRNAIAEQERQEDGIQRQLYGHTAHKVGHSLPIEILPLTKGTPLVRVVLNTIQVTLYKAGFEKDANGLAEYLHRVGKGIPKDTKYSLIIPMHISWQMEGATIRLRDFPLHLFSLPRPQAKNGDQQERESSQYTWRLETDFVIAEEMCSKESIRIIPSLIVPRNYSSEGELYVLDIAKSVMPVKSYADPTIKVNTTGPVRLGWGNSMQPAIQDMMRVLDSFTKPPVDPSERLGFWDKVRLSLHWMVDITVSGSKSDVVLHLKGSRDPYELLGNGAGFVKVWRGNVKFLLGHPNDEQEFLQIKSDQYILGIPNLKDLIDNAATGSTPLVAATSAASYKRVYYEKSYASPPDEDATEALQGKKTEFFKIMGNLTNGVRWGMGIALERACDGDDHGGEKPCNCFGTAFHRRCRIFTFTPHYRVVTKTPQYATSLTGKSIDSYKGFRSDFIHFSISLTSPTDEVDLSKRPSGQNSLYFSPEAFSHFWSWWKTFDGALSLPIRQGNLFPSAQAPSKKFGRHVATIKYRFGISPLFIAHTYKYENPSDWVNGKSVVLGFKAKISKFNVDLHARAIETTIRKPEMKEPQKIIHKAFYQAEIDCQNVEIRAISAVFRVPRKARYATDIGLTLDQEEAEESSNWEYYMNESKSFMMHESLDGRYHFLSSRDFQAKDEEWLDLDDFSDLYFWPHNNAGKPPQVKFYDCVLCPRISFLRKPSSTTSFQPASNGSGSDWESTSDGQPIERTKFGKEDTHTCFIGKTEDPILVQVGLLDLRLKELEEDKYRCILKATSPVPSKDDTIRLNQIEARASTLKQLKLRMLSVKEMLGAGDFSLEGNSQRVSHLPPSEHPYWGEGDRYLGEMGKQIADENSGWSNRLLVHNPSFLISNSTRDILLKYYYSYSQRRGYMYHISARAVKFILDLADQRPISNKLKHDPSKRKSRLRSQDFRDFNTRVDQKPATDSKSTSNYTEEVPSIFNLSENEQAEQDLPDDFVVDPADLVLLMRPQIAFRSEVDDDSTVILTAFHAQLKCFEVLDSSHIDDPVNANVMRRSFGTVRGFQMFYPSQSSLSSPIQPTFEPFGHRCLVPIEVLVDLKLEPWGFDRLIGRCTVHIAYDTFNQLRIRRRSADADGSFSTASQPHLRTSTDMLRVETADALSVHATATHYRAMYNVITDLCFYMDPAQKKRNAALETMQFAYDVDDLKGMAQQIQQQQARIRLYRRKLVEDYVHLNMFDETRMAELTHREYSLSIHVSDLNLMVEAIRRSQASRLDRSRTETLPGSQLHAHAKVITWHMLADSGEAIAKLSITDTRFERYSLPDTSASNRLYVQDMLALNISADPDRLFDEILSRYEPYNAISQMEKPKHFLAVVWKTLPPIAGISIVESFLLEIHPIRLQIEHAIGLKVHNYLFSHKSPTMNVDVEEGEMVVTSHDNVSISQSSASGDPKRLRRSRSMSQANRRQKVGEVIFPSAPPEKRSIFGPGPTNSQQNLPHLLAKQRQRANENPGFLNTEWRSNSGLGSFGIANSSRASRAPSIQSVSSDGRRPQGALGVAPNALLTWNKQKTEDATEMKKRAQLYKSFLFIDVAPTILCVSYSGPRYPDLFDLVVKVPAFHFESRTWSYSEFFDEIRRTCVSSLFKQSPSILGQIITTARKNKSVPKLMGQKVASGLKLKKRTLFERSNQLGSGHARPHASISSESPNLTNRTTADQDLRSFGHPTPSPVRDDNGSSAPANYST